MKSNRLEGRPRSIADYIFRRPDYYRAAKMDHDEWELLLGEWGDLNDLRVGKASFGPRMLSGQRVHSREETYHDESDFPGCDHSTRFVHQGAPAAIVTEPYDDPRDVLESFVRPLGLVVHQPPNPYASFWYPGQTMFLVITKPSFGEVKWLPEQLEFKGRPRLHAA